ncbi:cofilin family protein [Streptomyces sp. NPDC006326]|uniref:cofilin family protein n=1 Tax=Streptomyces sp. NPDC006326 TaxID=3156752 RepID=UPI0033A0B122
MSSPVGLSEACRDALHHVKETREVNTVILRYGDAPGVLVPEVEANLTHDELIQALPADAPRLVVHELSFATHEGARRHERLLIWWMPPAAGGQEATYAAGYAALEEFLSDVHVRLRATGTDQLDYQRLVALAG